VAFHGLIVIFAIQLTQRMKIIPFLVVLSIVSNNLVAQSTYTKVDSLAIFGFIDKAEEFFTESNYDSALFYCGRAENLGRQKNFKKGQAYALIEATDVYIDKDDLEKADATAAMVNKMGLQLKDSLITAITLMQMAQVKMYSDKFDDAIPLFDKSLQYYLGKHPVRYSALAYNDLGYTYGRKGELSKQAECLIRSISIYENYFPEQYGELGVAYNNLSTVYYGLNDMQKAIVYGKKSLTYREKTNDNAKLSLGCCNISQFYTGIDNDEAEKYLKLCVKYGLESKQESRIVHSYVTAANLYATNKKYPEAVEFELKAIAMMEKSKKDPIMLARRYMSTGTLYRNLKRDSGDIISYYNKSLAILQSSGDKMNLRDFYVQLSNYYSENKNYAAAYDNYKKYILYRDSIVSEKTQSSIAEIATRYETEKKDNEIVRLNTAQRIKQLEIEKQKAIITGNAATALQKQNEIDLLSKSQQLRDITIKQQEEQLDKQFLLAKTNAQQLQLTETENQLRERQLKNQKLVRNLLIAGFALIVLLGLTYFNRYQLKKKLEQQKNLLAMRNNISQDLHDDIGASLSNINILNELARRNILQPEKSKEYLTTASEDIQRISESLSDIVWNINPQYDDLQNLFIRMKRYAADMLDGKNIKGQFDFPASATNLNLTMTQRRDLYLIFKEAVNNLVKYSEAKNAIIKVETGANTISLLVKDDGKGFARSITKMGNGLQNMEQRAKVSGAEVSIQSGSGAGTIIQLEMKLGT
jgi:two-component system sensor histidine kinase UhpB